MRGELPLEVQDLEDEIAGLSTRIDRIKQNPQWGYNIRGILDDNIARGTVYKGVKVIGSIENLTFILPENKLDEIAITLGWKNTTN